MPTAPHLHVVPISPEQRLEQVGGEVIQKLRELRLRQKREAQRSLLADLTEHFMQEPQRDLKSWQVAEVLIARAVGLETGTEAK